jgi:acetyl esterase
LTLHPQAAALVAALRDAGLGVHDDTTPEQARAVMASLLVPPGSRPPIHAVEDRVVPGPAGDVPVRVYRPSAEPDLPVLVWLHGGGWVLGSLETHDTLLRMLAVDAGCLAVSVDYRLAPEHRYPAGLDDALAATRWVRAHARSLGADPARLALGGDSAGGNLAAVVALLLRDGGDPPPRLVLLVYPVTDHEFESPSMREDSTGGFLETHEMRWFYRHYCSDADEADDWRVSPMRAPDLGGLPRTLVVTAEHDPLRDQGEAFARRLAECGVEARCVRGTGLFHGFFGLHALVEPARPVWDDAIVTLRAALAPGAHSERRR